MTSVGIIGASGYTGAELLRLAAGHPELRVELATADTQAGGTVGELYPSLAGAYGGLPLRTYDPDQVDGLDVVFLALPHGASQQLVPELRDRVSRIVDLAADFRLADADLYPSWYGAPHSCPELLDSFVYGLPELFRDEILGASAVAAPGCYPTATNLALAPLVAEAIVASDGIVVDAASGVSGAGRPPKATTTFCTADEDFTAYGLLDHRHTPEMEQTLSRIGDSEVSLIFTPHLAPMNRGILATCYARPGQATTTEDLLELYRSYFAGERFVVVTDRSPSTKATLGSNAAHVTVRFDHRTNWIVAICAIDNLVKGASGQAFQCANLMLGLDEATGLTNVGVYP